MLTISGLPRAAECAGSEALPHANTTSEDSEQGVTNHATAEAIVRSRQFEKLPTELLALIEPGAQLMPEHAVAYNVATDTARSLLIADREYALAQPPLADDEVPGTCDLLILTDSDSPMLPPRLTVVDFKWRSDVGNPDENEQLMAYALTATRIFGVTEATVVVAYIDTDDEGNLMLLRPLVVRKVDAIDLDAFAAKLRGIVAAVRAQQAKAIPDVRESKGCRHCPALVHCPAKHALLVRLTSGQERDELEGMLPLTPQTVAVAYERLKHAENLLKRIRGAIFGYASEIDVPLGNGRVLGRRTKLGDTQLDGDTVYAVVREKYGQEAADAAVAREATQVKLEAMLKARDVKPRAPAMREVLAEVAKRGGSKRLPKETTDEHVLELPERVAG